MIFSGGYEGTAGTQVVLKIAADASGKDSHEITVTPIGDDLSLRNLAWIEANRRKVQELSGGELAYVYLPDTGAGRSDQLQSLLLHWFQTASL